MYQTLKKLKDFYYKIEYTLVDYLGLEIDIAYNYAYISGKISQIKKIPKKDFIDKGFDEISSLSDYLSVAVIDFKHKLNNFLGKFNSDSGSNKKNLEKIIIEESFNKPKENYAYNYQPENYKKFSNYKSTVNYLKKIIRKFINKF